MLIKQAIFAFLIHSFFSIVNCTISFDVKDNKKPCLIVTFKAGLAIINVVDSSVKEEVNFSNFGNAMGLCTTVDGTIRMPVAISTYLEFHFKLSPKNSQRYVLDVVTLGVNIRGVDYVLQNTTLNWDLADRDMFYECHKTRQIVLISESAFGYVSLIGVKLQAFNSNRGFSNKGEYCRQDFRANSFRDPLHFDESIVTLRHKRSIPLYESENGPILFSVMDPTTSVVCLLGEFIANFYIPYRKFDRKNPSVRHDAYAVVTLDAADVLDTTGSCEPTKETVRIIWRPPGASQQWNLTMGFVRQTEKSGQYHLHNVTLDYKMEDEIFPSTAYTGYYYSYRVDLGAMLASVGGQFKCAYHEPIDMDDGVMDIYDLRVEAFRQSKKKEYIGRVTRCLYEKTANQIPTMILGIVLVALIAVWSALFIFGRQRRLAGYESLID